MEVEELPHAIEVIADAHPEEETNVQIGHAFWHARRFDPRGKLFNLQALHT
jgi:hypothetical protein